MDISTMNMRQSEIRCLVPPPDSDCCLGLDTSSSQSLSSCLKKQDSIDQESSLQSPDRHVSFDRIEILEFPLEIGDNPSVHDGPPVQLGWTPEKNKTLRLDVYEVFRPKRRDRVELFMTTEDRVESLLRRGYSEDEILQAALESARIQEQRFESAMKREWQ